MVLNQSFLKLAKRPFAFDCHSQQAIFGWYLSPKWSRGIIVLIFKSGDTMDASNYRGITLVPMLDKMFAILLCTRISEWVEDKNLR
jgi:hypothetical protein